LDEHKASHLKAVDVMSQEVIACRPEDDLHAAEQLMGQHRKSRILVTENDGTLVGVISLSDVVAREEPLTATWTVRAVSGREIHSF
jgi:CBS domain-containing protein